MLESWCEVFALICCAWFLPDVMLCIMVRHFHFGLIYQRTAFKRFFGLFKCSFRNLSCAAVFFVEGKSSLLAALLNKSLVQFFPLIVMSWILTLYFFIFQQTFFLSIVWFDLGVNWWGCPFLGRLCLCVNTRLNATDPCYRSIKGIINFQHHSKKNLFFNMMVCFFSPFRSTSIYFNQV